MSNTTISISIPRNVYAGLKIMAEKDMRSARNYISKLIIQHVPENILPKEEVVIPSKSMEIAISKQLSNDDSNCMACGVSVAVSPVIHAANGKLCKNCKVKKYSDD